MESRVVAWCCLLVVCGVLISAQDPPPCPAGTRPADDDATKCVPVPTLGLGASATDTADGDAAATDGADGNADGAEENADGGDATTDTADADATDAKEADVDAATDTDDTTEAPEDDADETEAPDAGVNGDNTDGDGAEGDDDGTDADGTEETGKDVGVATGDGKDAEGTDGGDVEGNGEADADADGKDADADGKDADADGKDADADGKDTDADGKDADADGKDADADGKDADADGKDEDADAGTVTKDTEKSRGKDGPGKGGPPKPTRPEISADIRLVGKPEEGYGRLEVLREGEWGTVCSDGFFYREANIFCRHLGFRSAVSAHADVSGEIEPATGKIWLDGIRCPPHAKDFSRCCHNELGVTDCMHEQDVIIECTRDLAYRAPCCSEDVVDRMTCRPDCGKVDADGEEVYQGDRPDMGKWMGRASCTFNSRWSPVNSDMCRFMHGKVQTTTEWRLRNRAIQNGPASDHDTEGSTQRGYFLYVDAGMRPGGSAKLMSGTIDSKDTDVCLDLWYSIYGEVNNLIMVKLVPIGGTDRDKIMIGELNGNTEGWKRYRATLPIGRYYLEIMGFTGKYSDDRRPSYRSEGPEGGIALDSIATYPGHC